MQNSRLTELISSLDKKEVKEARQFLASPFFNHRTDVRQLYELVVANNGNLTKEEAARSLFPKNEYDPQQVRFVMSWLQKRLEEYFVVKAAFSKKEKVKTNLAHIFRNRDLQRHFNMAAREANNLLHQSPIRNADYHRQCFLLAQENHLIAGKKQRTGDQHLQELTDHHDAYYLIEKLRQACLIRSHQAVNNMDHDLGLLNHLLLNLPLSFWEKWPAAETYYRCFQMLDKEDGRPFFNQLKKLLQNNAPIFPAPELRDIFLFAINFSIRQFNKGDATFAREAFNLYQQTLSSNLLTLEGNISRFAYANIVALGLQLNEYAWVEQFLMEYKEHLEPQHREATFSFNLAKLEYERKDFDAAILLLQKADYKDVLLNLAAKTILLKIYFLLDEQRLLDSHLSAMRRFVKRKKIIGYHKENYLNIVHAMQKLLELNYFDKNSVKNMKVTLENTDPLTERVWLLEQLEGMGK